MSKKKIIIEIDKHGAINVEAEGYVGDSCLKSALLEKILKQISSEGEIDRVEKLFEESTVKKELTVEELI